MTIDESLAGVVGEIARRRGWELEVRAELPERGDGLEPGSSEPAGLPGKAFDVAVVDSRPAAGSNLSFVTVRPIALLPDPPVAADRVLCLNSYTEPVGRMTAFVQGASSYYRIHRFGDPPEAGFQKRLEAALDDVLGMPPYAVFDFHDAFPDRDFYRQAMESMQVPVLIMTSQGEIKLMNLRALAQFDYPTHVVIDRDWSMLIASGERGERADEVLRQIVSGFFYECSLRFVDRHGREFPGLITSSRVFAGQSPSHPLVIITIQDLTEFEALQRQFLSLQRREAAERVVAGMAHEFNNLLTAILGHAELLAEDLPSGTEYQQSAEVIRRQAENARQLTGRLLGLSSSRQFMPGPVSCGEVVRQTHALLARTMGNRIRLEMDLAGGGDLVEGDAGQLQQVLVNLCLNARDAIQGQGAITIRTSVREIAPEDCRLHQDWSSGIFVEMAVQDTGSGMGPAVLERVFEPFFTTKPVGSGTGLGLAVVRAIVRNHGGHVGIESEAGVGTTVMVRIPQSQPQVTARPEGPEVAPAAYANGGSGCILLVDDDREVLTYAQKVLQRAGYRVYPASNGMMAIDLFDQHQTELSLAIVDLTMPGPSGRDVIGHIRGRSQTVPIILCTGFAQGGLDDAIVQEVQGFLKKPFRQRDLLELVAEVIMG